MFKKFMRGFPLTKKVFYLGRYIVKNIAYFFNLFDKKPVAAGTIHFDNKTPIGEQKASYAIVMHTCDGYEFLRQGFFYFFKKYRNSTDQTKKYIISESKAISQPGRNTILSGAGERNQRLLRGLTQIHEEYIIYFQEDFWLLSEVDHELIHQLVTFCQKNELCMLKLHDPGSVYILETTDCIISGKAVNRVNKNSEYLISHAISLRKKNFLINILNPSKDETPRENEIIGTLKMKFSTKEIYQYPVFSSSKRYDASYPSKYREVCRKGVYNKNINEFIDILLEERLKIV